MTAALRSEWLKFRTTRMWWGMAIPVAALAASMAALFALVVAGTKDSEMMMPGLDDPTMVSTVYSAGLGMSRMLVMAIGVMSMGAEVRHRTLTATLLATPRRGRVMAAKVVSMLGIGSFYAVVHVVAAVAVGATIIAMNGYSPFPGEAVRTLVMSFLVLGLWGLIGLGIGILIPNQVAALMVSIGTVWIIEPIIQVLLNLPAVSSWGGPVSKWLPGSATSSVVGEVSMAGMPPRLEWWLGALVLAAYAAVATLVGTWLTRRRDVA